MPSSFLCHWITWSILEYFILWQLNWSFLCSLSIHIHINLVVFPWFSHTNVVILTTSNVTQKIDLAFVDRADIKQYIGPPSASAIFNIYLSCLEELMKVSVCSAPLTVERLHSSTEIEIWSFPAASDHLPQTAAAEFGGAGNHELHGERRDPSELKPEEHRPVSVCWWRNQYWKSLRIDIFHKCLFLGRRSVGLSGRALRKIPFLAHALFGKVLVVVQCYVIFPQIRGGVSLKP